MWIPTMRPSGRKRFGAFATAMTILLIAFLVPDTTVVQGARLLLQGGPAAVEKTSTTPEMVAPIEPEFRSGVSAVSPGSTCEAAWPQLSQVAANSSAMAQAIGPCRWGGKPNNTVSALTGVESQCFAGFDRNVYMIKFELFSICRFAYERYNITTMMSVSNFGNDTIVLNVNATKSSPATVTPSRWANTWKRPTWRPTWTRPQPPATPPCKGFNCNKPSSSSDAGKSADKDSKDEDSQSSSNSDSDSNGVKPSSSDSDSDSDGVMKKGSSSYHTQTDCKGFRCHSSGGTSSAEDKSQDRDKSDEDEEKSSQSNSDSDSRVSKESASDSDSDGVITKPDWVVDEPEPMPASESKMEPEVIPGEITKPDSEVDEPAPLSESDAVMVPEDSSDEEVDEEEDTVVGPDMVPEDSSDEEVDEEEDTVVGPDMEPEDSSDEEVDEEEDAVDGPDMEPEDIEEEVDVEEDDVDGPDMEPEDIEEEVDVEVDCMGEKCNEDNTSSDRDVSEDEDVAEEDKEKSSQSDSDSDKRTSKESASDSDSDGIITKPDWAVTAEPELMPESDPVMEPADIEEAGSDEAEEEVVDADAEDDKVEDEQMEFQMEPEDIENEGEEEGAATGPEMEPEDIDNEEENDDDDGASKDKKKD